MARKKLLTEGEVRQFMKLANLGALSENYFTNNPLAEQLPPEEEEGSEMEMGVDPGLPPEEEVPEVPLEDEEGLEGGDESEALLARVVQAVADELGVEVDVEGGVGEEGGEEELEVDAELEGPPGPEAGFDDMPPEEELAPGHRDVYEEAEAAPAQEKAEEEEEEEATPYGAKARERSRARREKSSASAGFAKKAENLDHDAIVAEVARRVAERLTADKQKEEMAEQLAERIFKRLTTK